MSGNKKQPLVPRLRFPEFKNTAEWQSPTLGEVSEPVEERVGERKLTPVSISAGIGFVPQAEKFGRDISGSQYKLYTVVRDGDFVYNKGNSLKFPQGCVYDLQGWGEVAAPNVFICFRLKNGYENGFYRQCFERNVHGIQLRKHITSGARSNGLLNISKEAFYGVAIPVPSHAEQQKIADCLSSLDNLIAAETQKLDTLKTHKKGLMQQLFPREGETVPRLRFTEFRNAEDWKEWKVGELGDVITGNTPSTSKPQYYEGEYNFVSPADISDQRFIESTKTTLSKLGFEQTRQIPTGSVLFVCIGSTIGKVAQNMHLCATNQQINSLVPFSSFSGDFIYYLLLRESNRIAELAGNQAVPIINKSTFSDVSVRCPQEKEEQERVAGYLGTLDDLIYAQSQKIDALKIHKKGLMQQLFPTLDEVGA
ncbi:TPA: restriction endonuclease subunit S [Pseudomonas aeruginosa]|nr:restriction endonuclease subunit S [Pseudomonas aeruginosa]